MNEVVKFSINTPVEVILQDEAGKRVEGRYGEQVMYSLLGNRVMYVPTYVEQRFKELAIGAGEPLLLCKQRVNEGTRPRTEWSVKRAPQLLDGVAVSESLPPAPMLDLQPVGHSKQTEISAR